MKKYFLNFLTANFSTNLSFSDQITEIKIIVIKEYLMKQF